MAQFFERVWHILRLFFRRIPDAIITRSQNWRLGLIDSYYESGDSLSGDGNDSSNDRGTALEQEGEHPGGPGGETKSIRAAAEISIPVGSIRDRDNGEVHMKTLDYVPRGIDDIRTYYGDPESADRFEPSDPWKQANLVWVEAPYELIMPWRLNKPCQWVYVHRLIAEPLKQALEEIVDYKGEAYLSENEYNRYGGSFHFRKMAGYDALSTHAFGIAIDLNPDLACWGCEPETQPEFIVEAFKKRGFEWGGDWGPPYKCDPQHFQSAFEY